MDLQFTKGLNHNLAKRDDYLQIYFWAILNQATILRTAGSVVKIGSSLKPNCHKQIELAVKSFVPVSGPQVCAAEWDPWCVSLSKDFQHHGVQMEAVHLTLGRSANENPDFWKIIEEIRLGFQLMNK